MYFLRADVDVCGHNCNSGGSMFPNPRRAREISGRREVMAASRVMISVMALVSFITGCGGSAPGGEGGVTAPPTTTPVAPLPPNPDSALLGKIVYTLGGRLHIYTVATRRDVGLGVTGINPKFSPDGNLIVFQNAPGVRIMNSDGTGLRVLDSNSGGVPSFAPDGRTIAFGNRASGVWTVNTDGSGLRQLSTDGGFQPAWSPDGTRIAYSVTVGSIQQLFIMNSDGTNQRQALTSQTIFDPVWAPSQKILFGLRVADLNYEIHSYDPADPASLKRLTERADNDFEPSWSPDGNNISWSNVSEGILIMKADGSGQHAVIPNGRQGSWGK